MLQLYEHMLKEKEKEQAQDALVLNIISNH